MLIELFACSLSPVFLLWLQVSYPLLHSQPPGLHFRICSLQMVLYLPDLSGLPCLGCYSLLTSLINSFLLHLSEAFNSGDRYHLLEQIGAS